MRVEKIDHIHIVVRDLVEVAKFFADIMGTTWVGPIDNPAGEKMRVAFDNIGIELQQPTAADTPMAKTLAHAGKNMLSSIGLKVTDLDEAIAELESKGIRIVWRGGTKYMRGAVCHPKDTMDIMLELLEYDTVSTATMANLVPDIMDNLPSPV